MSTPELLDLARRRIEHARGYTLTLLADLADDDWLRMPAEPVTHIAWQVGHLAFAEYALGLVRLRGRRDDDDTFLPAPFRRRFAKRSRPEPGAEANPSPAEIRAVFDRVHQQVLAELAACDPALLDEPVPEPYSVFPTRLGALLFCADHEMLHAGQIGLLRRLLGKPPLR